MIQYLYDSLIEPKTQEYMYSITRFKCRGKLIIYTTNLIKTLAVLKNLIFLTLQLSKKGEVLLLLYFGGGENIGLHSITFSFGSFGNFVCSDELPEKLYIMIICYNILHIVN